MRTLRELEAQVEAGKAAVALAEAEIRQAESELEFAESELTRARALIRNKTISERAHERARIDVDTRRAAVARAKSNLEVRKRELESGQARLIAPDEAWKGEVPVGCCVTVRAPVSGRVLRLIQESERVVLAGTPLVDIGDPENLELMVEYLSTDAVKVREGAKALRRGLGRAAADGQGHARGAGRLHQGVRARHRGAEGAHHPGAGQSGRGGREARPRVPGGGEDRGLRRRQGAARADQRAVPQGRQLGGFHRRARPRPPGADRDRRSATRPTPKCCAGSPKARSC